MDRHRYNADPDPDPNCHVDADADPDQDPDPVRHQNNTDPHADPTPSFTHVGKSDFVFTFRQNIATLQCFIFLISVKCVTWF